MSELRQLRYIFDHKQKVESFWILIMIVIGSGLELLGVSAIQPFINVIMQPERMLSHGPWKNIYHFFGMTNDYQFILFLIIALILIYVVKNVYLILMYRAQYKYIYSNMRVLSTKLMRYYLDQPYIFYTRKSSSEILRNINQDIADFFGTVQALVQLVTEGVTVLVLIVYLFIQDKTITCIMAFILLMLILLLNRIYKKKLVVMGEKNRHYEAQVTKWVQQAFGGIKEVKVMNKEDFFYREYDQAYKGRVRSEYVYHTMTSIPKPVTETCCIVALLGAIAFKLLTGTVANYFIPTLSIFAVAAVRMLPSFNRITEYLGTISYQKPAINAIYHDLKEVDELHRQQAEEEKKAVASGERISAEKLPLKDRISIQNLSFSYPEQEKKVLDNVSFDIVHNTSVAFIGASGAGKTTLADLILGVLRPTGGKVLADGIDIQQNLDSWHRTIGYIPQNIYLLDDTIERNIAFGIADQEIDEKKVLSAVHRAQLDNFMQELPDGLQTKVGERGVRLSGGQRQRIGIARALYNEPDVLILDEATSALDNETETAVMESIDALHGEMTLIIIAHRLSTIRNCDYIYRIGEGRAVRVTPEEAGITGGD